MCDVNRGAGCEDAVCRPEGIPEERREIGLGIPVHDQRLRRFADVRNAKGWVCPHALRTHARHHGLDRRHLAGVPTREAMSAECVHVARHDVRVALSRHLVGVRLAGRRLLLGGVERGEFVIRPEVAQIHPVRLERLQHVPIPVEVDLADTVLGDSQRLGPDLETRDYRT